jgi:tRNA A-37 threonylcarbamoyl transferase component Bud32
MQEMPFDIALILPDGTREAVCCRETLRTITGRRTVFAGVWQGRSVIVKRFEDFFSGYRCGREKRGLERLLSRGLATPKVLLTGKDAAGHHILVIEKIENAVDVLAAVYSASSEDAAREILLAVFRYVARMHQAGVVQKDLHLGNFLIAESAVFAIDPACMRFGGTPISLVQSRRQLAILFASLHRSTLSWREELLRAYCLVRGFAFGPELGRAVCLLTKRRRMKMLGHTLKKTLRNSKDFFILNIPPYRGVFYKEVFDESSARRMIERVKSTTVSDDLPRIVDLNGRKYRIACYQPKNRILAFWYRLAGSPARRDWLAAWGSRYSGRPVPKPAALIEPPYGLAWLITEKE